jgi:hypothetical protein
MKFSENFEFRKKQVLYESMETFLSISLVITHGVPQAPADVERSCDNSE